LTNKIKLTALQEKSWRSAQKASNVAALHIKDMQEEMATIEEKIGVAARLAAKEYNGILEAIAGEHGLKEIPNEAQLQVVDGVSYFNWGSGTVKESRAKKKAATKRRGRPKGSLNKKTKEKLAAEKAKKTS